MPYKLFVRKISPKKLKAGQRGRPGKGSGALDPASVLKVTEKVGNATLLVQQRCQNCHGLTVSDVLGQMMDNGGTYKMTDLTYDIKHDRVVVLPPGSDAGPIPMGKARATAPLAGKPLPPAAFDEFFSFLQCQLRMELREHTGGKELELADKEAEKMWPDAVTFVTPNLGLTERWVPYHTVLGVHELFLVQQVHAKKGWSEQQKFIAMFIFRAHCKRDLFMKAELPIMETKAFWQNPKKFFAPNGPMEKAILAYRKKTGLPLITSCFRIIPPRVLKDDTENLVRSITSRTEALLDVAEDAWVVMQDKKLEPGQKVDRISAMIQNASGCGETWGKMLTCCIDLAYPKQKLLESQCDVGTGAAPALKQLLKKGSTGDSKGDLKELQKQVNACKSPRAMHFWKALKSAETTLRSKFKEYPLVCAQAATKDHCMTAVTLQVQLCEYRQFRHSIARLKYGLPEDESMRGEYAKEGRSHLDGENFVEYCDKKKVAQFEYPTPKGEEKIHFDVPIKAVGGHIKVAGRIAVMCFTKLREGVAKAEVLKFRDEVAAGFKLGSDVPEASEAWHECRVTLAHSSPLVAFQFEGKDGKKIPFQTTVAAAGGILEAERIARLCWAKLSKGASKDSVIDFRNNEYKKRGTADVSPTGRPVPAKRAKTS